MSESFLVRRATTDDIDEILRQRVGMLRDMGHSDPVALEQVVIHARPYLARVLSDGSFFAWLASTPVGDIAGGGAIVLNHSLPHTYAPAELRRPKILNVYTYPEFRRRGVGRAVMETMIAWCRDQGFPAVTLHASDDGRSLYASLGFEPSNEMRLELQ